MARGDDHLGQADGSDQAGRQAGWPQVDPRDAKSECGKTRRGRSGLTGDQLVTYDRGMDDDLVFRALADPTRRFLLDQLYARDGRTLKELKSQLEMTRFGVMKHPCDPGGSWSRRQPAFRAGEASLPQPSANPVDP